MTGLQIDSPAEGFAGLALRLRGRTGLTQRDLAARLGVHVRSVQLWEAGASHPAAQRLEALIEVILRAGGFSVGIEEAEAETLWNAAMAESARLNTPFDAAWFAGALRTRDQRSTAALAAHPMSAGRQHWGDAPAVDEFLGRADERATVRGWVLNHGCRVVGILGLGGVGKSLLAARLAHDLTPSFEHVYWRSLRNMPTPGEWLAHAIGFLSPQDPVLAESDAARLDRLLELLRETPRLLVLDNVEAVLRPGERAGRYLPDVAAYGDLLRRLAETPHRSCLLLTSREEPPELGPLSDADGPVRILRLAGLAIEEGRALIEPKGLFGDGAAWEALITRYGGNGLALKMTGASIHELFGGDIAAYLADLDADQGALFGGVRQLLDSQVQRLSGLEQELMRWLAIEREPVSFVELAADVGPSADRGSIREAVAALRGRSLLERREPGPTFTLQSVVLEYATEQLIDEVARGVASGDLTRLLGQPLLKATAKEYVRRSQERLIATPILEHLVLALGGRRATERRLIDLLDELRRRPREGQGYAPGNVLNLLRLLRGDLRRLDLSALAIRQAYLPGIEAQEANLAGAHLSECVLPEAFHQIAVALSDDGAHLLAGTTTGDVCLWRAADRTLLLSVAAHAGVVMGVALCAERGLAASASQDGTVKLWEAGSGRPLTTLRGHTDFVQGVALSGDGALVASASQDGTIKLWRAPGGELLRTLPSPGGGLLSVVLSEDGALVAGGTHNGTIALWETTSGRLQGALTGHTNAVSGLALSGDGRLLASASQDGSARLWDVSAGTARAMLVGHVGGVWDVALSRDGTLVASGGQDASVRLWSGVDGRPLATLLGHTGGIWQVSLSGNGERLASVGQDGSARLWESRSGRLLTAMQGHTSAIWDVALSGNGRSVASASQDGAVKVWDTADGVLRTTLRGHNAGVQGVALSHDGRVIASSSQDGTVRLWEVASGKHLSTLSGHAGAAWDVALSDDGRLLLSAGYDGTVKVWDAPAGRLVRTLRGHTRGVRGVALNDARQLIVSGSQDGSIKLWDVGGQLLATLDGHVGGVLGVAVDAAGRLLASGGFDGAVKVWDAASTACLHTMSGHAGGTLCVALSADGGLVASGGFDHALKLWDVPSGGLIRSMLGHQGAVWGAALSPDGRLLASGSFDGTVKLWHVSTGACLRTFKSARPFERTDVTGLTGITAANRAALMALGAVDRVPATISV
ncbi:MAG: helix-turn-helix domain-containing protein [Chloroflexi bacterium]|nr:helix-turn-helix domain-containing protein [Chloroflexota bacterium]